MYAHLAENNHLNSFSLDPEISLSSYPSTYSMWPNTHVFGCSIPKGAFNSPSK